MSQHKIENPAEQFVQGEPETVLHPGAFIRSELLGEFRIDVKETAERLGVNRAGFSRVLAGTADLSDELAYRLEALFGVDAALLMGMQRAYSLHRDRELRERLKREIQRIEPRGADARVGRGRRPAIAA